MYSVIIWIAYIIFGVVESTLDGWKSKKGGTIDHRKVNLSVIIRVLAAIGLTSLLTFSGGIIFQLTYMTMLLMSFWIVFDMNFNFVRDGTTGYVGTTAITDKIVRWIGVVDGTLYAMIKLMVLGIVFGAYQIATPIALCITMGVIGLSFLLIYITYLIKTKNGDNSKSKI